MSVAKNMMFNAYTGAVAALTALAAHKAVDVLWKTVTGEEPPEPNDPSVPANKAFAWVAANALSMGILGVAANRFAANRWLRYNDELPTTRSVNVRL